MVRKFDLSAITKRDWNRAQRAPTLSLSMSAIRHRTREIYRCIYIQIHIYRERMCGSRRARQAAKSALPAFIRLSSSFPQSSSTSARPDIYTHIYSFYIYREISILLSLACCLYIYRKHKKKQRMLTARSPRFRTLQCR